ncbi:hypothetical protein WMY93_019157 [Mugilogobius chulae]|uniref:L1 transposable element RRM domain-containing protein n=1 Tax=Mugilogobius chulae TaxID=88201 RepID=A0AAW0NHM4_9GOBI
MENADQSEYSLQTILGAIQQSQTETTAHIDNMIAPVQSTLINIQASLSTICDQITELEQRVNANECNIENLTKRVAVLEKDNAYLRDRAEDAENRSRANNLRFVNVPENSEGTDPVRFITQLLIHLFGVENLAAPPVIERAHRSPATNSRSNAKSPRVILVKFQHFPDKVKILRLAREKKELHFEGNRISIYPDFSADLLKRRRQYDEIKKKLRAAGKSYSLLYPATLRVTIDGKTKIFRTVEEAQHFFRDLASPP